MVTRMFCVLIAGCLLTGQAWALQRTLTPVETARIVNPRDAGDVRVLFRFEIPEDIAGSDIILATLRIDTDGTSELPFSIGLLEADWSSLDDWAGAAGRLEGSPGFDGTAGESAIVANHLEPGDTGEVDTGVEIIMTPWVRTWAEGENHGVAIRGVSGRNDNLSGHLAVSPGTGTELVILYAQR